MTVNALSCFMKDLTMSLSSPSRDSVTITIIDDNAKQSPLPSEGRRRRAAPRRSVSYPPLHSRRLSPEHHMSRWEARPSVVGPHDGPRKRMSSPVVKSSPVETSPITIPNDRVCRWESSSPTTKSSNSNGLKRPTRKAYGAMDTDSTRRNNRSAPSSRRLPSSLRKLPYLKNGSE
jgi:hypothetical protein